MTRIVLALWLLFGISSAVAQTAPQPYSYDGVALGTPLREVLGRYHQPPSVCSRQDDDEVVCSWYPAPASFGDIPLSLVVYYFYRGKLNNVCLNFPAERYEDMLILLSGLYGPRRKINAGLSVWEMGSHNVMAGTSKDNTFGMVFIEDFALASPAHQRR